MTDLNKCYSFCMKAVLCIVGKYGFKSQGKQRNQLYKSYTVYAIALAVGVIETMDLIHYSFAPLILFRVPYTLDLLP